MSTHLNFDLKSLLDALPGAVYCKNPSDEFRYIFWNQQAEALFGLKATQIVGKTDYDFLSQEEAKKRRSVDIAISQHKGNTMIREELLSRNDGSSLLLSIQERIFHSGPSHEPLLLGFAEDVTERTRLVRGAQSDLAGLFAHEINTPLATLGFGLEQLFALLHDDMLDLPKIMKCFEEVTKTSRRLGSAVDSLSQYSRQTQDANAQESVECRTLVREVTEIFTAAARMKQIQLKALLPEKSILAALPAGKAFRVLSDLTKNAISCSPMNSEIEYSLEIENNKVKIAVNDAASEITESHREFQNIYKDQIEITKSNSGVQLAFVLPLFHFGRAETRNRA